MNNQVQFPKIDQSPRIFQSGVHSQVKSNQSLAKSCYRDENEMTGYRNFKNEQMTERNFFNPQQSLGTEITISLNQREWRRNNCKEQLQQFIDSYYAEGKIKITVTFDTTLGESQQKTEKKRFNLLNLSIKQTAIDEEDKLCQQRIYQFKGKQENNLQGHIEMIIYGHSFFPYFEKLVLEVGGKILFKYDDCLLQIPPPQIRQVNINDLDRCFDTICDYLENTTILQIECSSNAEALAKYNILIKKEVYQLIERSLNVVCWDVVYLNLEIIKMKIQVNELFLQHDQLYFLIQNNGKSIVEQQNKLNEILKSKEIIKKESITDSIIFYDLPEEEDIIQIKINHLRRQYPQINIEISNHQTLQDQKLQLQFTTTTWLVKDQEKTEFIKQAKDIKSKIEEIHLPYKIIKIPQNQKVIWENYLSEYFLRYSSCFSVHSNGDDIEIALKTNQEKWRELEKQLSTKLQSCTWQIIKLEAKPLILNLLKNCKEKNKLFNQVFKNLLSDFQDKVNITIKEVDEKNILCLAVLDKHFEIKKVQEILETQFMANLSVKKLNLLYKESLEYFNIQVPEQISKNDIFVHQGNLDQQNKHQAFFLGLNQHLKETNEFLKDLKSKYQNAWITQEFKVENTLIYNCLQSKYRLKEIELKLGATIDFTKEPYTNLSKIVITGFQNYIIELLKQLSMLENRIKGLSIVKSLPLNNQQINQLTAKFQQLQQIQQKTSSYFEFKSITSFNPEESILEKLTFEGKELCIVKGDITQIQCEAIVYQIMNDKCEFGEIGLQNQQVKNLLSITNNDILKFFKEIMKDKQFLNPGELFYYKVNTDSHVDHIFNIYPPTYRQAKTLVRDQKIIQELIQNIFQLAKEKNIKQIAFPVISVEIFGFYMNMASQILLKEIINCLFQEDCNIKQIFILENDDLRCKRLTYQLNHLLSDNPLQKTENYVKYQWQWFEQDHFEDYDDYEVNRKICKFYTQFEKGQDQQFNILYPYSKYPGTHLIDLDKQRIWDKTHNNSEQTIISIDNFGERKYYIDGKQVSDDLNRYLIQQEIQGKRKFDIFYKFYEIYLTKEGHYQKNLQFGNIRPIQFIPYENRNEENVLIRQNSQFKIEKLIEASNKEENGSKVIFFEINQQKQVKYDQVLVHTLYDDENMAETKILELLENTPRLKSKIQVTNRRSTEQIIQVLSPNRKIVAKRQPLQDKN
ncbi:unnamed protein product [Paramecium octaurelia]|uniref:Macro domain-containing protein n=1 Tax=Paramecium octaurelia TaxID=43137 RepID=A0A8S1T2T8_PAROT|nr:unnamed protein product [Paramecium octaurelia]